MRNIFILVFTLSGNLVVAQQYSGVNVNRIKGRIYKGATAFESYHQFSAGINLPRSLNYTGDTGRESLAAQAGKGICLQGAYSRFPAGICL